MDKISLILVIIGALNWGLVGLFGIDLVATIFGGSDSAVSRIIYTLVGLGGLWAITLLFRERETVNNRWLLYKLTKRKKEFCNKCRIYIIR